MIDYSIGEIESLILKACRGSGMSWGLSEEGARAAGILSMLGLPGLDSFARLLPKLARVEHASVKPEFNSNRCTSNGEFLCPVYAGAWLLDTPSLLTDTQGSVDFAMLADPLIFSAFALQGAIQHDRSINLVADNQSTRCLNGAIENGSVLTEFATTTDLELRSSVAAPAALHITHHRGTCTTESLHTLEQFAHKTYVPASEASRLAGAGAGLTDND